LRCRVVDAKGVACHKARCQVFTLLEPTMTDRLFLSIDRGPRSWLYGQLPSSSGVGA